MVPTESTDEADDDESLGEVGGRSLVLSSSSSLSSKIRGGAGGNFDRCALAKDLCKSLIVY